MALLVGPALAGCRIDDRVVVTRTCDSASPDGCGEEGLTGMQRVCFSARQLGGQDFCAPSCRAVLQGSTEQSVCVNDFARLKTCDPLDPLDQASCDELGLDCFRTKVAYPGGLPSGLCMTGGLCSTNRECGDGLRSTCATTVLREIYPNNPELRLDHLHCLQRGCEKGHAICQSGESCLTGFLPPGPEPSDICVPNCDANLHCPPGYSCSRALSTASGPAICRPGLLGSRCDNDMDCLIGSCMFDDDPDPQLRQKLCMVPCTTGADCKKFDGNQGRFACVRGRCLSPRSYQGEVCRSEDDCLAQPGTVCAFPTAPINTVDNGICLRACSIDHLCPSREGFGHVCIPLVNREGGDRWACLPGIFGTPCRMDTECLAGLSCLESQLDARSTCTTACQVENDCLTNPWTTGQSMCWDSSCIPWGPAPLSN